MTDSTTPTAAYVHIPFCVAKCHYCDFSSYPAMEQLFSDYVRTLVREIREVGHAGPPLGTVYFGGGTPTVLAAGDLGHVLVALSETMGVASDAEVTVETNPGTIDESKLAQLRSAGFNRLSIGVQSFDDEFLARLGRIHTGPQAEEAFAAARAAGFANLGLDLMFALPGQTPAHWSATIDAALALAPEHISLYELTIEEGTRFAEMCAAGLLQIPDEDARLAMYELTIERLAAAAFEHYEVSNFARPGFRSRHNQVYWHNEPYYGFGAGATSYIDGVRAQRLRDPAQYIATVDSGKTTVESSEKLEGRALLAETIIQGLRMLEGVDVRALRRKTGSDVVREFEPEIASLQGRGLMAIIGGRLRVTHAGLLLLNDVSEEFLG